MEHKLSRKAPYFFFTKMYMFSTLQINGKLVILMFKTVYLMYFPVKGVNFYGPHSEYIISGSDCGNIFLWDREAEKVVQFFHGDEGGVVSCYCKSTIFTVRLILANLAFYIGPLN